MTFCLHNFPSRKQSSAHSRTRDWIRFVPRPSFLLRLVESHLGSVQRVHRLLAKPLTHPIHPDRQPWLQEDHISGVVLRYGIELDALGQSCIETEAVLDDVPFLHLVASSPILKACNLATSSPPPPPPRFTPLAVRILRKRLAIEPVNVLAVPRRSRPLSTFTAHPPASYHHFLSGK